MHYEFGPYAIDESLFELRFKGQTVGMQPRAFELLLFLVKHRNRIVTKRELLNTLWDGTTVTDAAIRHTIKLARKALRQGDTREDNYIRTVHGRGFRFSDGSVTSS
jgi:DNA-binding winged helix-turn-helix (wHTH) protein